VARIDLNADVGESFGRWALGEDEALLPFVTSANVACGFHAGDPTTLRRTCVTAVRHGVVIGAQVGYRDLAGFGRRFIDVDADELHADVLYQLGALEAFARLAGARVGYLKPHGALYHATVHHLAQAEAVVSATAQYARSLGRQGFAVLGLPGSALLAAAASVGLRGVGEAFADRGYTAEGALVPRGQPGALITDAGEVAARAVRMATSGDVVSHDGAVVAVRPESICLHGDTPGAAGLAGRVRAALGVAGVAVRPFVDPEQG